MQNEQVVTLLNIFKNLVN